MTNKRSVLWMLIFIVYAEGTLINSITITAKDQSRTGCLIAIQNTNELLDIRSNCQFQNIAEDGSRWAALIPSDKAYSLQADGYKWKGYRYFKNPIHYKQASYNFTLYESLLKQLLNAHSSSITLIFDDKYRILVEHDSHLRQWKINKLEILYTDHIIQKIQFNGELYTEYISINRTSNLQHSVALRKLDGKGLHQKINLTLKLDLQTSVHLDQTCKLIVSEILPESTYIDVDQLRTIQKFQVIETQKPEHASKQYFYSYTIPLSKFTLIGSRKYAYLYPIHFRYPEPSHLNYTLVALHPSDEIRLICNNGTKTWLIEEELQNNRGYASIFNGSIHDTKTVSMITFILTVVAAMIIIKQLRKI